MIERESWRASERRTARDKKDGMRSKRFACTYEKVCVRDSDNLSGQAGQQGLRLRWFGWARIYTHKSM
eukprot:186039-Amorphochlora_amoeboformis.AAC.1